jgi:hypothetical protein
MQKNTKATAPKTQTATATSATFNLKAHETKITVKEFGQEAKMNQPYSTGAILALVAMGQARVLGQAPSNGQKGKTAKVYAVNTKSWEKIKEAAPKGAVENEIEKEEIPSEAELADTAAE